MFAIAPLKEHSKLHCAKYLQRRMLTENHGRALVRNFRVLFGLSCTFYNLELDLQLRPSGLRPFPTSAKRCMTFSTLYDDSCMPVRSSFHEIRSSTHKYRNTQPFGLEKIHWLVTIFVHCNSSPGVVQSRGLRYPKT